MEELSSNNLIKIINHSHNHTNQREGKHSLLIVFNGSWNIKSWTYFYIGVYLYYKRCVIYIHTYIGVYVIYNSLPKYTL